MKPIYRILPLLSVLVSGYAQSDHEPCHLKHDSVVVFANGIWTTDTAAAYSTEHMRAILRERLSAEEFSRLAFDTAYNENGGRLADLYEALEQRVASANVAVSFWRWLSERESLPDPVREELLAMAETIDASEFVGYEDIADHLAIYRSNIRAGRKVVVACHSQGNLFCNAEHSVLEHGPDPIGTESFGIVAIANPANFTAGDGPHTTLVEDLVIKAVAASALQTGTFLPQFSNITNIGSGARGDHWSGHTFTQNYMLRGTRTVDKVIEDIVNVRNGLAQPPKEVEGIPGTTCVCTTADCSIPPPPPLPPEPPLHPMCSDDIDNELDGKIDWDGGPDNNGDGLPDGIPDPGCTGPDDRSEFNIISIGGG